MKKTILLLVALAFAPLLRSQTVTPTVLSSDGGYSSLSNGSISWSIGEPISESYTGVNNITTMGFHQPELTIQTMIIEQGENIEVLVYPNPVKEILHVNFSGLQNGKYKMQLSDAAGKLIHDEFIETNESNFKTQLKMNEVAEGNYFLHISGNNLSKTVKLTKVN